MYCPKCGSEISADAAFCPKCGQKVQAAVERQDAGEHSPSIPPVATGGMVAGNHERGLGEATSISSNQEDQAYDVRNYPGKAQQKERQQAPSTRRSRKPLIIGSVTVLLIACIAVTLGVGYTQGWFGGARVFAPNEVSITEVFTSDNETGTTDTFRFERDDHGNLVKLTDAASVGGTDQIWEFDYSCDQNGYVTHVDMAEEQYGQREEAGGLTFNNEVDSLGRLAKSTLQGHTRFVETGDTIVYSLTASYSYFGETDDIEEIIYSGLVVNVTATLND